MTTTLQPLQIERRRPTAATRSQRLSHDWLLVGALVVAYAAMQSPFVRQPPLSDQLHYFVDAASLPHISEPAHQGLRIGLTIPVWLMIKLFAYSEAAYYAVPYLSAAGLVVTTYWLGRLLDSRATGLFAGLLVFVNPFVIDDGSQLLPDIPATTLLTAAITLLIWRWQTSPDPYRLRREDRIALVVIGILLGWSYLVREFIVVWFPAAVLVGWMLRLPRAWWRLIGLGAAGTFTFELLWGLVFFGDPFARITAALNQPASPPWRVAQREQLIASGILPDTHGELLLAMPSNLVSWDTGWIVAALAAVLLVGALLLRKPHLQALALWVFVPIVLLTLVIQFAWLFDNRILRPEKLRYWLPVLPPLVVGGVMTIMTVGRRLLGESGALIAAVVAATLVLTSVMLTGGDLDRRPGYTRTGQDEFLKFREWVASAGQTCEVIWVDADHWRAASRWVPMYLRGFWGRPVWDGELRHLNRGDRWVDVSELDTGALVRSRASLYRRQLEGQKVPSYMYDPPSEWRKLLATNQDRVRMISVGPSTCARP